MGTQEAWTMAAAASRVRAEVVNCMFAVVGLKLESLKEELIVEKVGKVGKVGSVVDVVVRR